ncbi:MAG: bestrophin family ion channel [Pirellulales bacterium]
MTASYRALIRWGIALYLLSAPWAVAAAMGWWGLPVIAIGAGFFLGMEFTAEVVEQPFGHDGDDLPLEVFCQTIRTFVEATVNLVDEPTSPVQPDLKLETIASASNAIS